MLPDFGCQHALFLQGPNGPFFRRLADELSGQGVRTTKVNFNAGDALFFRGPNAISYRQPMEEWPVYLEALVEDRGIDAIFLFGDCRPLHRQAIQIAHERGLGVWVFEEGYLRPNHITCERDGVNGNSRMPKDPEFYRAAARELPTLASAAPVGRTFPPWAWYTVLHATIYTLFKWRYPRYRHHRNVNMWVQAFCWVRGWFRKHQYRIKQRNVLSELARDWSGRYFFVPLQVHCDQQIQNHSPYEAMEDFIDHVVSAFAANAPADTRLVLKHHPHDRPYKDYGALLRELGERHGCADRLVYVHDLHLPTLLEHARGTITMNSTVGPQSMSHGTPVKVLGKAVYDIPGLTSQGSLEEFFDAPGTVDMPLYDCYTRYLRATNQINGSFYKRTPGFQTQTGLHLPEAVEPGESATRLSEAGGA